MSIGFEIIHGSVVILRQKTTYKQTAAYHRKGEVYAKGAGGFVKLKVTGGTTHPDITWEELEGVKGTRSPKQTFGYVEYKK